MSVRHRRVVAAGVAAAAAVAVPVAAAASGPGSPSAKPSSVTSKSAAAASKSAAAASEPRVDRSVTGPVTVAALVSRLGVGHSAAQRALAQVGAEPPGWRGSGRFCVRGDSAWSRGESSPVGCHLGRGEAGRGRPAGPFGRPVLEHND